MGGKVWCIYRNSSLPLLPSRTFPLLEHGLSTAYSPSTKSLPQSWSSVGHRTSASVPRVHPPQHPFLPLVSAELFLTHFSTTLPIWYFALIQLSLRCWVPSSWLLGAFIFAAGPGYAWCCSRLEPVVSGMGQSQTLLIEASPVGLAAKNFPWTPKIDTKLMSLF